MRIRLALHLAWPKKCPVFKLGLTLAIGSPTTVSPKGRRKS